jgi:signal transduction histidine kinase
MQNIAPTSKQEFEILIVDDDETLVRNLCEILKKENYQPFGVSDGKSALAKVQTNTFDLALMEMRLTDTTGMRLVEKISRLSPRTDFIILTGSASLESAAQAVKKKNILAYEVKPVDTEHLLALIRQIAERRRLEREILGVSEDERRRFGHELHDSLGQQLTGAALRAKFLAEHLKNINDPHADLALQLAQLINQSINESSRMARGLAPIALESKGLTAVLEELVNQINLTSGIACDLAYPEEACLPEPNLSIHLYRIAQEAIQNALKHSQATRIHVELSRDQNYGYLEVTDDGRGIPDNQKDYEGMGLKIMKYRAKLLGGLLEIDSPEDHGTRIRVCYREGYGREEYNHEH